MPFAIHTENLTRDFKTVRAVEALSLDVPPGIVFGFLGPNGSGKTTTIRLLLGLLEPTQGRAEVLGHDTRTQSDAIREKAGALLEHTGLYERLSAEENLNFYGRIARLSAADRQARSKELLTQVGLWERRKEQVSGWSRGMKQKLAVARALLHRPQLIFLDEPTSGLDPVAAAELREHLGTLAAREGATVFLTTHNLTEAEKLCAQVAIIRKGKLLAVGHPDELRGQVGKPVAEVRGRGFTPPLLEQLTARPEVTGAEINNGHLVIQLAGAVDIAPLISLIIGAGGQVEEVRRGSASLEDAFLDLVEDEK